MTNYKATSVDEYIASSPSESRPNLEAIRQAVESVMPSIEKEIGYGKPYYKYHGWVAGFDVYKNHTGFEVWDGLSATERTMLEKEGYKTGSVTFQIRHDQKVPAKIIKNLVKAQVRRNEEKSKRTK